MASSKARKRVDDPRAQIEYHEAEIRKEREKWFRYRKEGTGDQWPDGVGLNLTRNHIIWHLMEIASIQANRAPYQLSIFDVYGPDDRYCYIDRKAVMADKRIPPEVDNRLMVTRRRVLYGGDDVIYEA